MTVEVIPNRSFPMRIAVRTVAQAAEWIRAFGGFLTGFVVPVIFHAVATVIGRLRYRNVVISQISDIAIGVGGFVIGGGMVFVIVSLSLFAGAEVGLQGFTGLSQIGAESFMGLAGSFANVREITPVIAGAAMAAQIGTAFTAELGAMRVSDEIDALEVMGLPPMTYLVSTRLVATLLAVVPLYLVSLYVSFFATRLMSVDVFGLSPGVYDFYFQAYLPSIDILYSVIKVIIFAILVVLIHCYYGFHAFGGPAGVGQAVGRAVRTSIMTLVVVNLFLSWVFWGGGSSVTITG